MPIVILLSVGSEAEKGGVRGWGIGKKDSGAREGAGRVEEEERNV